MNRQISVPPPPGGDSPAAKRDASAREAAMRGKTPEQVVVDRAKQDGAEA